MIIKSALYAILRAVLASGFLLLCLSHNALANSQRILVLGDSISAAYGMSLEQGWVTLMASQLADMEPEVEVINASISGETTAGGLRRLPALLAQHKPGMVIVELGANDGLRGFPLPVMQDNLGQLARLSREAGATVILVAMEIPPNYGARYTAGFRQSFAQVAEATQSTLAPFLLDGVATNPELMQDDGIHPNAAAQPLLLDNILPTVQKALAD